MCTCLIAGRNASITGKTLLAANDDWDGVPGVLAHVPCRKHGPGETYILTGGREIPQLPETWGYVYTACSYVIGTLDKAWAGGLNDRGVAAAGCGASAFRDIPAADAWLEPDDVLRLILERAESARHGVLLIGELIARYGIRPSAMEGCESMAVIALADRDEGWFLELAPGDHWIAVRVPDDEAAVRVNAFAVHDADLTDHENVLCSPGLAEYARARGWWDGDERRFDFADAYGAAVSPNEWGPELDPMNMRRRWRAVSLFRGADGAEDATEYSVKPSRKLELSDLTAVLRDVYEDTAYDLRKVPEAGRYGNPFHDGPVSYSLCRHATVASIGADFAHGALWAAMSTPAVCAYIPVYADIEGLPPACGGLTPGEPSLFWEWKEVSLLSQRRYGPNHDLLHPEILAFETEERRELEAEAGALAALPAEERRAAGTELTEEHIRRGRALCASLRARLLERY